MYGKDDVNDAVSAQIQAAIGRSRENGLRGMTQAPGVAQIDPGEADEATGLRGLADAMVKEDEEEARKKAAGGGGMDIGSIASMASSFMG